MRLGHKKGFVIVCDDESHECSASMRNGGTRQSTAHLFKKSSDKSAEMAVRECQCMESDHTKKSEKYL